MSRLKTLRQQIGSLSPRLAKQSDAEGHSATAEPWRKWYHLARWKHPQHGLRIRVLTRDLFTCQWPGCGRVESNTALLVADHREPHRGDPRLFWCEANLWTLCKPHHDGAKQQAEQPRPAVGGQPAPRRWG